MTNTHNIDGLMREYGGYPPEWDIEDQLEDSVAPGTGSQHNGWPDNLFETPGPSFEEPQSVPQDQKQPSTANGPKKGKGFLAGPIDAEWLRTAIEISSPAIIAAIPLWFTVGVKKDRFIKERRSQSIEIKLTCGVCEKFGIQPHTMTRGLHALANHGLITIVKGGRGRRPVVVINNMQDSSESALSEEQA